MFIKIVLLIIVLLQLTVCAIAYIQFKRQKTNYPRALIVHFLWGIAICINMLYLALLISTLKYDLGTDERLQHKQAIVVILILILLEIAYILFQYIKRGKWMDYLRYFTYISLVAVLVALSLIMIDTFKFSFVIVIFEVNVVAIVTDGLQIAKYLNRKNDRRKYAVK